MILFGWSGVPRWSPSTILFLAAMHAGAAFAFRLTTTTHVVVASSLYVVAGFGMTVGYHRLLSHRSFRCAPWLARGLGLMGTLVLMGGPIHWVAVHRHHHAHAEADTDPHSIGRGLWHAHAGWFLIDYPQALWERHHERFAPDLCRDPFFRSLDRFHYVPSLLLAAGLLGMGGIGLLLWGICVRVVFAHHATYCVNSVCHRWGWKCFEDAPGTNNGWVALLTLGEGWHNNHHARPSCAAHGLGPAQVDASWLFIKLLGWLHLAWDIRDQTSAGAETTRTRRI